MSGTKATIRQLQFYSAATVSLRVELVRDDGVTMTPVTISGSATTVYTLEARILAEGTYDLSTGRYVGCYITNLGTSTVYINAGLDKTLVLVSSPSTSSANKVEPSATYQFGEVS